MLAVLLSLDQDEQGTFFSWPGSTDTNKEAEMWPGTWQPCHTRALDNFRISLDSIRVAEIRQVSRGDVETFGRLDTAS